MKQKTLVLENLKNLTKIVNTKTFISHQTKRAYNMFQKESEKYTKFNTVENPKAL